MPRDTLELVDTPLARWLNTQMAEWVDPDTGRIGLSGNRLGELSGISQTLVWDMLKVGKSQPKAETLIRLAEFFDVSPMFLLRLVYLPESEDEDFSPGVREKFEELESILAQIPVHAQLQFIESVVQQAKMMSVAVQVWSSERELTA